MFQTSEGLRVNNTVAVALEAGTDITLVLVSASAPRVAGKRRTGREHYLFIFLSNLANIVRKSSPLYAVIWLLSVLFTQINK